MIEITPVFKIQYPMKICIITHSNHGPFFFSFPKKYNELILNFLFFYFVLDYLMLQ